jgi:hypothetical protein
MAKIRSVSAACLHLSIGVVALALASGCESKTGMELDRHQTEVLIHLSPIRKLDLVFMIDNSLGMPSKLAKLNSQLPTLFSALKDPTDGSYPDLRVAIIDSDLGTGGAYFSGSCGPNEDNGQNAFGDVGNFQMRGAYGCGMTSGDALWIEYSKGSPVNFSGSSDNINNVFSCLTNNLGTGCEEEHQLQAFEFALLAQNLHSGKWAKQNDFLRPEALLGLVFLSDEDDCSAATNDSMFGTKPELRGESMSLRCATRGHACKGVGNLSDAGPGYPTSAAFQTDLASCSARTDACPNTTDGDSPGTDSSGPTACSPLKSVKALAKEMKALKGDQAAKILVAGIFGWPLAGADGKPDFASAEPYRIDQVPNPSSVDVASPQNFDLWPVCYDPAHRPRTAGQFDAEAWSWGAQPGLRMSAFIDEFGDSGLKFSACERDYAATMQSIGSKLAGKIQNVCFDAKLVDKDPSTPALDPDCRVAIQSPIVDEKTKAITYLDTSRPPPCAPGATSDTVTSDCWELVSDLTKCPASGQLVNLVRTRAEMADGPLPEGTRLAMQCRTCTDGVNTAGCSY